MDNPVILITGALTGIGRATSLAFAKEGATVVASGRREAEGKALEDELNSLGAKAAFILADVRHEDDVRNLVEQTVARFGRLDAAVNNAGTEGKPGPLTEQTLDSYAGMLDTNVLGTLLSLKHELRVMQSQGSGSTINISSTMGERGAANLGLYTASKHAVEGLTKSAALEAAAFGVRVNAVAPGPTETAMLDRLTGTPDRKAAFYAAVPLKRGARLVGTVLFAVAPDVLWLFAARTLMGVGLSAGPSTAAVVEFTTRGSSGNSSQRAALIAAVAQAAGFAAALLLGGTLIAYAPWPTRLSFWVLAVLLALLLVATWFLPRHTTTGMSMVWRPRVPFVPSKVRKAFATASLAVMTAYPLHGLPIFLLATAMAGAGYSLLFLSALQVINTAAPAQHRGAVLSALYLLAYLWAWSPSAWASWRPVGGFAWPPIWAPALSRS